MRLTEHEVTLFKDLLENRSGILLSSCDVAALDRAVFQGMESIDVEDPGRYYAHLVSKEDPSESYRFVGRMVNNETYFFRESEYFRILGDIILPEVIERRESKEDKIRILSAGCSTGSVPC